MCSWKYDFSAEHSEMDEELLPDYEDLGQDNHGFQSTNNIEPVFMDYDDFPETEDDPDYNSEDENQTDYDLQPEMMDQDLSVLAEETPRKELEPAVGKTSDEAPNTMTSGIDSVGDFDRMEEVSDNEETEKNSVHTLDAGSLVRRMSSEERGISPPVDKSREKADPSSDKTWFYKCWQCVKSSEHEGGKSTRKNWSIFKSKVKDFFSIFTLWKPSFKKIEGSFGTATLSYFRFVRWLFLVNMLTSIVIISSILLPQIFTAPKSFEDAANCSAYDISYNTMSGTTTYDILYNNRSITQTYNSHNSGSITPTYNSHSSGSITPTYNSYDNGSETTTYNSYNSGSETTTHNSNNSGSETTTHNSNNSGSETTTYNSYNSRSETTTHNSNNSGSETTTHNSNNSGSETTTHNSNNSGSETTTHNSYDNGSETTTNGTRKDSSDDFIRSACQCSQNYSHSIIAFGQRIWYLVILDILQGTEWMERSVLFLGYYFDRPSYMSSLAFLFSILGCFIVILWIIVMNISATIKSNIAASRQKYSEMIFCSWDFMLTDDKAANRKHRHIFEELVGDLKHCAEKEKHKEMSRWKKFGIFLLRLIVFFLIGGLLGAAGFFLYELVITLIPRGMQHLRNKDTNSTPDTITALLIQLLQYLPSISLNVINILLPFLFQLILHLAFLTQEIYFAISLILAVFTRLASIAFLIITLYVHISENVEDCFSSQMKCWESSVGQLLYNLAIMDFLIAFVETLVIDALKRCLCTKCGSKFSCDKSNKSEESNKSDKSGRLDFDIAEEVLAIVYAQTICWMGAFFCPLIVLITTVKLFITFYIKKFSLFLNCEQSSKLQRASRFNFFFMILLLLSLTLCYFLVTYAISWFHPSKGCSPFRIYAEDDYYMYRAFSHVMLSWPIGVQETINFIFSWKFILIAYPILITFICYFCVIASRNRRVVQLLESQMKLTGGDAVMRSGLRKAEAAHESSAEEQLTKQIQN